MLCVLLYTIYAYKSDSNLYPVIMILASPPAAAALIVVWIALLVAQKREAAWQRKAMRNET